MKKILALILALAMVLPMSVAVLAAESYSDVTEDHWAFENIKRVSDKKWFGGYPDGTFRPQNSITRAESLKVFDVFLGLEVVPVSTSTYYDVDVNEWYSPYIEAGKELLPERTSIQGKIPFQPNMPITREDAMYALVKALGYDSKTKVADQSVLDMFSDKNSISSNVKAYVAVAVTEGLVSGHADGTIGAQDPLTRAEFATLLYRASFIGFNVTADAKLQSVSVEPSVKKELKVGESFTVKGIATYSDGTTKDYETLNPYNSDDNGVVSINKNKITALKAGVCEIHFNDDNVKDKSIVVIVAENEEAKEEDKKEEEKPPVTPDDKEEEKEEEKPVVPDDKEDNKDEPVTPDDKEEDKDEPVVPDDKEEEKEEEKPVVPNEKEDKAENDGYTYLTAIEKEPSFEATGSLGYVLPTGKTDKSRWYKVVLPTDGFFSASYVADADLYTYLNLYAKNGSSRIERASGKDKMLTISATLAAGTYYIKLEQSTGMGNYRLTTEYKAQKLANDDESVGDYITANEIKVGDSAVGHIGYTSDENERDKLDWYTFEVTENGGITATLVADPDIYLYLELCAENGSTRLERASGKNKMLTVNKQLATGKYYLKVEYSTGGGGAYTLTLK